MMKGWSVNRRGAGFLATSFIFLVSISTTIYFYPPVTIASNLDRATEATGQSFGSEWKPSLPVISWSTNSIRPAEDSAGWTFIASRDERNFSLSADLCLSAFPDFYYEIDRALEYRRAQNLGRITEADVDIHWRESGEIIRIMIHDNQLYVIDALWADHGMDLPRGISILQLIHRAIVASPSKLPNIEVAINLSDWPLDPSHARPLWVFTRHLNDLEKWVMPDFGYWTFPGPFMGEYSKLRNEIMENEPSWEEKKDKAVWRGATVTNKLREKLVEMSRGREWADVESINWGDPENLAQMGLTIPQHCYYQYVLHSEGHSYSGRAKYLLNCHSVSIVHELEWVEPHTHLFISAGPSQNMVSVDRDFKQLDGIMKSLLSDDDRSRRIAQNSVRIFRDRYLTPAAQACYWRKLITAWASVSFEPKLLEQVQNDDGTWRKQSKGKPFETWMSELVRIH